jgi:hypothetical protein
MQCQDTQHHCVGEKVRFTIWLMKSLRSLLSLGFSITCLSTTLFAQNATSGFHVKETVSGLEIFVNDSPFATYVTDKANKPYLYPVYGPTGKAMTRAYPMEDLPTEPQNQRDHHHHRGITFGHEDAAGSNTWIERATLDEAQKRAKSPQPLEPQLAKLGRIRHLSFQVTSDASHALVIEQCEHTDSSGKRLFTEERRLTFRATPETRSIDIDQDFHPTEGDVIFADIKDAGLSIRVPCSMAVDSAQGGHIINSNNVMDKEAWAKPAKWCDYYGPVDGELLGIAFFNHPSSHRYPTPWHVRTYGLFTANAFGSRSLDKSRAEAPTVLKANETLKLRHRLLFHKGDAASAHLEEAFATYASETK